MPGYKGSWYTFDLNGNYHVLQSPKSKLHVKQSPWHAPDGLKWISDTGPFQVEQTTDSDLHTEIDILKIKLRNLRKKNREMRKEKKLSWKELNGMFNLRKKNREMRKIIEQFEKQGIRIQTSEIKKEGERFRRLNPYSEE